MNQKDLGKNNSTEDNVESNKNNRFLQLPNEILLSILGFFNKKDLSRTALTCQRLYTLTKHPSLKNSPWPLCDYSLPPICRHKVINFEVSWEGLGQACDRLELLPNSDLVAIHSYEEISGKKIQLWNLATAQCAETLPVSKSVFSVLTSLGFSENCLVITESNEQTSVKVSMIKLWDINAKQGLQQIKVEGTITALAKVADHCLASATNTTIQWWDLKTGKGIKTLDNCGVGINKLLAIPEKGILISGDLKQTENTIKIWDTNTNKLLITFNNKGIRDLALISK